MKKFVVTVGALFVGGVKYRRGDIVEIPDGSAYGTKIEPFVEPQAQKPRRGRPKIEAKHEDR